MASKASGDFAIQDRAPIITSGCAYVTNSTFKNWRRGVSDNENAKDIKSFVVDANTFDNAPVYMSAHEEMVFTANVCNGSVVSLMSYSNAAGVKVTATDNILDAAKDNSIGHSRYVMTAANVEAQESFTVIAQ